MRNVAQQGWVKSWVKVGKSGEKCGEKSDFFQAQPVIPLHVVVDKLPVEHLSSFAERLRYILRLIERRDVSLRCFQQRVLPYSLCSPLGRCPERLHYSRLGIVQ